MLATLSAGFLTTVATGAHAQNSEIRSNAIQKKSSTAVQFSKKDNSAVVELRMDNLKDSKRVKQEALARSLAPKIQQAAERQGVKASRSDIMEASEKLASIIDNSDILDLGDTIPGIKFKIKIKFYPKLEASLEITF